MTWEEWVDSIYNTVGLGNMNNGFIGIHSFSVTLNSVSVKTTDYVQSTEYEWNSNENHTGGNN